MGLNTPKQLPEFPGVSLSVGGLQIGMTCYLRVSWTAEGHTESAASWILADKLVLSPEGKDPCYRHRRR